MEQNNTVIKGSRHDLIFQLSGNYANDKLLFTVKEDPNYTARVIYKRNVIGGGSANEIEASYNYVSGLTTITIKIYPVDTRDQEPGVLVYDLVSEDADDDSNVIPLFDGSFRVETSVRSYLDNSQSARSFSNYLKFTVTAPDTIEVDDNRIGYEDVTVEMVNGNIVVSSPSGLLTDGETQVIPTLFQTWEHTDGDYEITLAPGAFSKFSVEIYDL